MTAKHVVKQGEHLGAIARKYGYANYTPLWDHPQNAELKKLREDPMLLAPGDELFIPDHVRLVYNRATDASHEFKVKLDKLTLKLCLLDSTGKPRKNAEVTVRIDPPDHSDDPRAFEEVLTTDGDGNLSVEIASHIDVGSIEIDGVEYSLGIGALDPVDTPRGAAQRLANLGFLAMADTVNPEELRLAIADFQAEQGLEVTGEFTDIQSKLEEFYGS